MSDSRVMRGAILLVVLAVIDIVGSLALPAPDAAPPGSEWIGAGLGVLALVPVLAWFGLRGSAGGRVAMWIAVVFRILSALLPILGLGEMPVWMAVVSVLLLALAVVGVVMVRPALGRRATATA
ncbi:hypothetical protein [Pseudonocardia endophytica]|uniref:Uncharacterized protein n=1 Tax=Pseudonocardia endophytica TaxID=401976 RepID=A0A4R1HS13_PSEEN|nr:hypothetical protein [Pseudonocardia endophytica]TCK22609.1 hypothetical protein EV378_6617 [Pseudonocardia endophytica]